MDVMGELSEINPIVEDTLSRIKTNKILYRQERKAGLRTGERWLETQYALIPWDADPKEMVNFLLEEWRLPKPNLVISIIGGTSDFTMSIRRRELFRVGIAKAAATTGAWIISSGLNRGILKMVGETLREHAVASGAMRGKARLTSIAFASLSQIEERPAQDQLIRGAENNTPALLTPSDNAMLNPNNPYALLVTDDREDNHNHQPGKQGAQIEEHGAEIELRCAIERELSSRSIAHDSTIKVPILYFLVNGDPHHIRAIHTAIENKTPVMVLAGSKGCADVIAAAYTQCDKEHQTNLRTIMTDEFGDTIPTEKMDDLQKKLGEIIKMRHLITVYEFDGEAGTPKFDIDEALLSSLLKGTQESGEKEKLFMAVVWKRFGLAQSQLMKQYEWKSSELFEALRVALINDQTDFIRLFLNNNVDLDEYLQSGELRKLYNEVHQDTLLHKLLIKEVKTKQIYDLNLVGNIIKKLTTHGYKPALHSSARSKRILNPCRELFLWAVLQDRQATARLFWEEGKAWIGGALVASCIMRAMQRLETESQKLADLEEHRKDYEHLAIGVLDECYREDRRRTSLLLIREMPEWGNESCVSLAAAAHDKRFIAHPAVQHLLSDLWMGRVSRQNGHFRTWLATLFPVFIFWGIKFVDEEKDKVFSVTLQTRSSKTSACVPRDDDSEGEEEVRLLDKSSRNSINDAKRISQTRSDLTSSENHHAHNFIFLPMDEVSKHKTLNKDAFKSQEESTRVRLAKRMSLFFSAPAIHFRYHVISHVLLLVLFSYVLLAEVKAEPTITEYILICWVSTLAIESVRQMISVGALFSLQRFIHSWLLKNYYLVDAVSMVTFFMGTILRHYPNLLDAGRITYSLTLFILYFRLLHIFSINKHLGPKLIMIIKMLNDLLVFLCILLVFLLAYGIACQAVLFPHVTDPQQIMKGIFYRSYFQIYGELFLEELEGRDDCSDTDPTLDPCPANTWFGTVALAVYLFISNVLLLNLLIAMLNYTFALVQENTDIVWKFQRYSLIKDYYNRPILAPPFIIISHILIMYDFLLRCWCGCCDRFAVSRSLRRKLPNDLVAEISSWEKIKGEEYVTKNKKKQTDLSERISGTEQKLNDLSRTSAAFFSNPEMSSELKKRLHKIEDQMEEMKELMLQTLDALAKKDKPLAAEN